MAIREGAWDCPSCGRKGNRGPEKYCGGCGSPRGPEVTFYLPEDAPEVRDEAALRRARSGPDWSCAYCHGDNPADHAFCSGCGASREGAAARRVIEHRNGEPTAAPAAPSRPRTSWRWVVPGVALLAIAALLVPLLGHRKSDLTVTGFRWTRTIEVQAIRTVTESAWEGEVPQGARVLDTSHEVHHVDRIKIGAETKTRTVTERVQTGTEKVRVGSRDLGNGYFEDVYEDRPVYESRSREETYEEPVYRDQPVYRKRYRYEIDRWLRQREVRAEGGNLSPSWPDTALGAKEREGTRREFYEVLFQDATGRPARYAAPNEQVWRSFDAGRTYRGRVGRDGDVTEIEDPTAP